MKRRMRLTKLAVNVLEDKLFLQLMIVIPEGHFDASQVWEEGQEIRRIIWVLIEAGYGIKMNRLLRNVMY